MKSKTSRIFDALIGLALAAFVFWSYYFSNFIFKDPASFDNPGVFSWLESLEFKLYDARSQLRTSIDAGGREIAIVAIDDDSIARLGRWPWPRTRIAQMIDVLSAAKPKVLGIDIVYSEPEDVPGTQEIHALQAKYQALVKSRQITQRRANFASEFDSALTGLNFDAALASSFAKAGNVALPMMFTGGGLKGAQSEPMPAAIASSALTAHAVGAGAALGRTNMDGVKPVVPLPMFAEAVQGVGHVNVYPDFDGTVRREYPVVKYNGAYYPSFALQLVLRYLGFAPKDAVVTPGQSVQMGRNVIPLDETQAMLVSFNGPYQTFHNYSFFDVLNGKVSMDVFKDKIVLLGPTAAGVATLYVTPVAHNLPAPELMANIVENMLHLRFLTRSAWAHQAELGSIGVAAAFLLLALPFLGAFWGALLTLLLLAVLSGAGIYYFIHGLWLKIAYSGFLLAAGYVLITTRRFFAVEKGKERVEASAIETNKMLGLSFQGQGMLDLAFEKFRLCPVDGPLKELLYNLGLDFERKRQYNKAAAVYEHIAAEDPKYKDIADKIKMLKQAAEGAVFGGVGGKAKEGTVLTAPGASKPTLGRYEVEKEIGRGSMGIVYLGNDPKINRKVAIKTMVLEEGMDAAVVKETRERFFREAESAGTLNHPNIVRIFDAGEEHDVSYIAMEFLDGHDLSRYTAPGSLLPFDVVIEYTAKVAEALDYAHAQGIVHRDVKPANIMLLKDNSIRVTDFGIARITASSKTATGTVVGTPAYMSPEQVSGKKVDGRSDIFSLGVVFFELVLGQKPFKASDGGIGTLLFQIANDPEPDPAKLNPQLPPCIVTIIRRALKKDPAQRYQKAGEMAAALRSCSKAIKEGLFDVSTAPQAAPAAAPAAAAAPIPVASDDTVELNRTVSTITLPPTAPVSPIPPQKQEAAPSEAPPQASTPAGPPLEPPRPLSPPESLTIELSHPAEITRPATLFPSSTKSPQEPTLTFPGIPPAQTPAPAEAPSEQAPSPAGPPLKQSDPAQVTTPPTQELEPLAEIVLQAPSPAPSGAPAEPPAPAPAEPPPASAEAPPEPAQAPAGAPSEPSDSPQAAAPPPIELISPAEMAPPPSAPPPTATEIRSAEEIAASIADMFEGSPTTEEPPKTPGPSDQSPLKLTLLSRKTPSPPPEQTGPDSSPPDPSGPDSAPKDPQP